jgi:Major Facilitator Superfamily
MTTAQRDKHEQPSRDVRGAYGWFVGGVAAWFAATGIHQVILSWLLVGELGVGAQGVGIVQMLGTLPILCFLLFAGATADRRDRRRLLIFLHVVAAALSAALATCVGAGLLGMGLLITYVIGWGTVQAFTQPTRDALISDLAKKNLLRGVAGLTLTQFLAMAVGARAAALGEWLGNPAVIGIQAALLLLGLIPLTRLPRLPSHGAPKWTRLSAAELRAGLSEVARIPGLGSATLLVAANGLFFNGPYLVLCPIIIREVYDGTLQDLSQVMVALPLGTIVGSAAVILRGRMVRKGSIFLAALLTVSFCLLALYTKPPLFVFVGIIFVWGLGHSLFFNASRTLFQEAAPDTHRARVLAVHPLAFLGMSPISTLAAGVLGDWLGPLETCAVAGTSMVIITTLAWSFTGIRRMR